MAPKRIEEWFDIWNYFFEVAPYALKKKLSQMGLINNHHKLPTA